MLRNNDENITEFGTSNTNYATGSWWNLFRWDTNTAIESQDNEAMIHKLNFGI